jgi:hypothetical protein
MELSKFADRPPCIELPEERWRELEATLGLTEPNLQVRRDIARYVERHLCWAEFDIPKQRPGTHKRWVTRVRKKAQHLTDVLDWAASEDETDNGYAQMHAVDDLLPRTEQGQLLVSLKQLVAKADKILVGLPQGKGGRDADEFAWGLVFDLAFLYEWATKKQPTITYNDYGPPDIEYTVDGNVGIYEGPFLEFVTAVLATFAPDRAKGNLALGKHVERVLKVWRRRAHPKDKIGD